MGITEEKEKLNKRLDPDYKGEQIPDEILNGPVENRKCTDVLCCLFFIAFIIAWLICGFYGFSNGDPMILTYPYDSDDNQCGRPGRDGEDYKYLYYPFPLPGVLDRRFCVKDCPSSQSDTVNCLPNNYSLDCTMKWGDVGEDSSLDSEWMDTFGLSDLADDVQGIYKAKGYLKRFCLPDGAMELVNSTGYSKNLTKSNMYDRITNAIGYETMTEWVTDAWICWEVMFIVAAITIVIAAIYLFLLRYCIGVMVWISIILTFVSLLILAIFLHWSGLNQYEDDPNTQKTLKILGYIMYGVSGLFIIYIFFMCNRIRLAIAILKAGVSFVKDVPLSLLIPPVFFILIIVVYIYWTLAMIWLWSNGETKNRGTNPVPEVEWDSTTRNALYFEFFGVLWVNAFIIALEQFILASSVCIWYFSAESDSGPQRPISRSIWRALFYHLGSLAFGSFILAVIWTIKYILMYISKKLKDYKADKAMCLLRCFVACLMCYVNCFERFIKFLNKNAYIQIALHSTSFCTSAAEAFYLILRNAGRFLTVGSIGHIFQMLGKGIISIISTYAGYMIITHADKWADQIHSPVFPTIVFLMISFLIAEIFMSVYGMACDTILHCFLCDEEICARQGRGPMHSPDVLKDFMDKERKEEDKKGCCRC